MAQNTSLILRTEAQELFSPRPLKISPTLQPSPLSLTSEDLAKASSMGLSNSVAAFYKDSSTLVNPSTFNQSSTYSQINASRLASPANADMTTDSTESKLLEQIPAHRHINETRANLVRMASEYTSKLSKLQSLRSGLFDPSYSVDMYNSGRGPQVFPANGRFTSVSGEFRASGYIKVEDAATSIRMEIVLRGVPCEMRRSLTSSNSDGTANYIFTYPQYLISTEESINSVQHIAVYDQGGNAKFYHGASYSFPVKEVSGDYANLEIANKVNRNETGY